MGTADVEHPIHLACALVLGSEAERARRRDCDLTTYGIARQAISAYVAVSGGSLDAIARAEAAIRAGHFAQPCCDLCDGAWMPRLSTRGTCPSERGGVYDVIVRVQVLAADPREALAIGRDFARRGGEVTASDGRIMDWKVKARDVTGGPPAPSGVSSEEGAGNA